MSDNQQSLTRIGVFYDGNYFLHVSNYYAYHHERRSRLSISGLHEFVRHRIAEEEKKDFHLCQIVDAHYFRGRLSAQEASAEGNRLFYDRLFDDILMMEGVTTHYLPVRTVQGYRQERGIDVWMALEAFELTLHKKFDVVILIASDSDFVPLVRKLHTLGVRVMLLAWDYEYYDEEGRRRSTVTSQYLWEEVTYPLAMQNVIDDDNDEFFPMNRLFVERKKTPPADEIPVEIEEGEVMTSTIYSLKDGYGFISFPQTNNLFFHYSFLIDTDFNDLREGDSVEFTLSKNERGEPIARNVKLVR
ncbi:MAG: NYN domain-containing protein [Lewinellaceae bacterium]|nr:NYN domain-containing protein [Saprospiraceae bacterium]MCB9306236.1 NYN domain-containing protein [Lewinellaceae bacterium]MCB9354905.1 NYN domain-containing protein [Lewinellaceae bacterium]